MIRQETSPGSTAAQQPGGAIARRPGARVDRARRGAVALDYILVLGIVMPMIAFTLWLAPRIMNQVYQMTCVLVSSPFM